MTSTQITDVVNGTHSLDDRASIQAAMNANAVVDIPPYIFRSSGGLVTNRAVMLHGEAMQPFNAPAGSEIDCDLAVSICLDLTASVGVGVENLVVGRAAGTPPGGSIGVRVQVYNPTIRNVFSRSHAIGWYFGPNGISAYVNNIYTGAIYDAHVVQDSWPELRIMHSRFGMNGGGDPTTTTTYIRIKGGNMNPAGGPNTTVLVSDQFNGGQQSHFIEWVQQTTGATSDLGYTVLDDVYVEDVLNAYLYSDSTWPLISRLQISNSLFNSASAPNFTALNAATAAVWWQWTNNRFTGPVTFAPAAQGAPAVGQAELQSTGNFYEQGFSITGPDAFFDFISGGDDYAGGLTIAGTYRYVSAQGNAISWTDTSTATNKSVLGTNDIKPNHITVNIPSGSNGIVVNGNSGGATQGIVAVDPFSGAGSTAWVDLEAANNTNGLNILLKGNGGTTPKKTIRVFSGVLQFLNDAYNTVIAQLTDSGQFIANNGIGVPKVHVSQLPTCNGNEEGILYPVDDANSAVFNAALVGGGTNHMVGYCNGSGWVVH
jgi:hypothetical protein